jgi:hypothetical protein
MLRGVLARPLRQQLPLRIVQRASSARLGRASSSRPHLLAAGHDAMADRGRYKSRVIRFSWDIRVSMRLGCLAGEFV